MDDADEYDDPEREAQWLEERRQQLLAYLNREGVTHGPVAAEPAWFIAPCVSVWPVMSLRAPGAVGWWGITGDLPTDILSSRGVDGPRAALRAFAARWSEVATYMRRGEPHPAMTIGPREEWPELGDLLQRRAELLQQIADDEAEWQA